MTALDYAISAGSFGIGDSWNPYMLAVILCFLIFLAFVGDTLTRITLAGRTVILVVFGGVFALSWGANVWWPNIAAIDTVIRFLSLGVAVALLTAGCLLFQQWRHAKQATGRPWLPLFLREDVEQSVPTGNRPQKNGGIIFFSVILGVAALALLSVWPQDRNIYPIFYALFMGGNVLLTTLFFAIYSLAFVFWLIVVYWIVFLLRRSAQLRRRFVDKMSWLNVSFAALFIAAGMGLIFLFTST